MISILVEAYEDKFDFQGIIDPCKNIEEETLLSLKNIGFWMYDSSRSQPERVMSVIKYTRNQTGNTIVVNLELGIIEDLFQGWLLETSTVDLVQWLLEIMMTKSLSPKYLVRNLKIISHEQISIIRATICSYNWKLNSAIVNMYNTQKWYANMINILQHSVSFKKTQVKNIDSRHSGSQIVTKKLEISEFRSRM